jgi:RAB6A-GEF complex partner protein 1
MKQTRSPNKKVGLLEIRCLVSSLLIEIVVAVLPLVIRFLSNFQEYLNVIVQCTRKTEVASWSHLFSVVGSPQVLFEESLARGLLKTAGGYLLILHTMEQLSSSSQDMVRLFSRAVAEEDWDLCKELARFLTALDNSGKTLREALELVELRSPGVDEEKSFMFESARRLDLPGALTNGSKDNLSPASAARQSNGGYFDL